MECELEVAAKTEKPGTPQDHMAKVAGSKSTSGLLLARNAIWNIVGQTAPMLVAVYAIPRLIRGLGTARFGVLTIAWMVVGYFSFFDFGLGRALTKVVADKLGSKRENELPQLVWTSIGAIFFLGCIGTMALAGGAHLAVYSVLKVPEAMRPETLRSFYLLAFAIPIVTTSTGLRGVLEAHQEFALLAAIRIPLGMFTFGGPLLVLIFSQSMVAVVAALLTARLITCVAHMVICLVKIPQLRHDGRFETSLLREVLRLGGWMTVSNLISPLLVYVDRFMIGALVSVSAVAYYATPFEMISKMLIVPLAMMGPLFPAFAVNATQRDHSRSQFLLRRAVKYIFLIVFPVTVLTVAFAPQALRLWLGQGFAEHSAPVLQWLAVGILINCIGQVPAGLVQGYGRPDLAAKFHMTELPIHLLTLWLMLRWHGIVGAAIAWTARVSLDACLLFMAAMRLSGKPVPFSQRTFAVSMVVVAALSLSALSLPMMIKLPIVAGSLLAYAGGAWWLLNVHERALLLSLGGGGRVATSHSAQLSAVLSD